MSSVYSSDFLKKNTVLVVTLLLAAVLRLHSISNNPPSLNWDEVSHGYNAYSILKTGKDEWGVSLPTIFRAYGDYKLPVYIYTTVLSEAIFGLTAFAVRLSSVLAGLAAIIFTYLLTKRLFDKRTAQLAAILVAIEPWSFFLSRVGFEANLALAFTVSGVYFLFAGLKNARFLLIAAILLGLSVWTYNSARIFVPALLVLFGVIYWKEFIALFRGSQKLITYSLLLIAFFFLPMLWQIANPIGQARYSWVAILDEGAIAKIEEERFNSILPPALARLAHNRVTFFALRFLRNWPSHYSPKFLFWEGGSQYQQNIPGIGLIYPVNAIFLLIGIAYLVKANRRESWLFLGWLLLAPIPSSLTRDAPHVLRSIIFLPIPMILTGLGLTTVLAWSKKKEILKYIFIATYSVLLAWSVEKYLVQYFGEYQKNYSWSWQYGYQQVVNYAKENYNQYDRFIVTKYYGEPHEFFLFYWPWNPEKYQNDPNLIRFFQTNWYWVDRFDKFYFVNDWEVPKVEKQGLPSEVGKWKMESGGEIPIEGKTLLITSPGNFPPGWRQLKTIEFLDGRPAFDILEKT